MTLMAQKRSLPPSHLLQRILNNPSQADFEASFDPLRTTVFSYLEQAGLDFASFDDILDLGCGVGRFMFAVENHLRPGQTIHGAEVHRECAHWCRDNIAFAETIHNSINPPMPYKDGHFNLVYALSVFTHLRLDMQFRWAWEVHRLLKPGGVLFVTLHGPTFFPVFHSTRNLAETYEVQGIGEDALFSYIAYPSGEDLHQGQIQVASAHSPGLVNEQFAAFEIVKRFPFSALAGGQDLYIIRKPEHGRAIATPKHMSDDCAYARGTKLFGGPKPTELTFALDGQETFTVYPRSPTGGSCWADFRIEIQARSGETLVDQAVQIPQGWMFGGGHFGKVSVAVPPHRGEVTARLSANISTRGHQATTDKPKLEWCFPYFA